MRHNDLDIEHRTYMSRRIQEFDAYQQATERNLVLAIFGMALLALLSVVLAVKLIDARRALVAAKATQPRAMLGGSRVYEPGKCYRGTPMTNGLLVWKEYPCR